MVTLNSLKYLTDSSSEKGIPSNFFELCSGPSSSSIRKPSSSNPQSSSGISVGHMEVVTPLNGTPGFGDIIWHNPLPSQSDVDPDSCSTSSQADSTRANFYCKNKTTNHSALLVVNYIHGKSVNYCDSYSMKK
jgi:hypothetical protein